MLRVFSSVYCASALLLLYEVLRICIVQLNFSLWFVVTYYVEFLDNIFNLQYSCKHFSNAYIGSEVETR